MKNDMNKFMSEAKEFLALSKSGDPTGHQKTLETVKHSAGASKDEVENSPYLSGTIMEQIQMEPTMNNEPKPQ